MPFAFSVADRYAVLKLGEIADDGVAGDELLPHVSRINCVCERCET